MIFRSRISSSLNFSLRTTVKIGSREFEHLQRQRQIGKPIWTLNYDCGLAHALPAKFVAKRLLRVHAAMVVRCPSLVKDLSLIVRREMS